MSLTPREARVAQLIAEGRTAKEAALEMGLAEPTIRTYVMRIARRIPGRAPPMRRIALWYRHQN